MKKFLRLFGYVKRLEADLESVRKELKSERWLVESQNRYIEALEGWKKYFAPRIPALEAQNETLRMEIAELKRRLSGGS